MDLINLQHRLAATLAQVTIAVQKEGRSGTNDSNLEMDSEAILLDGKVVADVLSSLEALQCTLPPLDDSGGFERFHSLHDGKVHDPLGAGSYLFRENYIRSLFRYLGLFSAFDTDCGGSIGLPLERPPMTIVIHVGAQPNNSLHAGTIVVFALAFLIGRELRRYHRLQCEDRKWQFDLQIQVQLDLVDTAPDSQQTLHKDGISYQRSQRNTQAMHRFLPDYEYIMKSLFEFVDRDVSYTIANQETLMSMPSIPHIITTIVKDRERLGTELSPEFGKLAIRCACPHFGCGYAEKHGLENTYSTSPTGDTTVSFNCPTHGRHSISLSDPANVMKLEFNTPLRNLVRTLAYGEDSFQTQAAETRSPTRVHLRVTGADYAGMYQEQLLWRQLGFFPSKVQPVIIYSPLIVDWAGSKLSKSLYVEPGAYQYLRERNMDYLLSFERMKECNRDEKILFREVEKWVLEPKKLFRSFSIEYLHKVFEQGI